MNPLLKLYNNFLDILFPIICLDCGKYLENDDSGPICPICLRGITLKPFFDINSETKTLPIISIGSYSDETLRKLIHSFKYEGISSISRTLDILIKNYIERFELKKSFVSEKTIIIPIPLFAKRKKERGFNQAEVIADILGKHLSIEIDRNILKRTKNTKPQITLESYEEREKNIKGAFSLAENMLALKDTEIILVDDVLTSGSTIKEALRTLRRSGAKNIKVFVIAKV